MKEKIKHPLVYQDNDTNHRPLSATDREYLSDPRFENAVTWAPNHVMTEPDRIVNEETRIAKIKENLKLKEKALEDTRRLQKEVAETIQKLQNKQKNLENRESELSAKPLEDRTDSENLMIKKIKARVREIENEIRYFELKQEEVGEIEKNAKRQAGEWLCKFDLAKKNLLPKIKHIPLEETEND